MEGGPLKAFYNESFKAFVQKEARLIIDCPGDACGIHPDIYFEGVGGGSFGCHNVDQMFQQLSLLAGLSKVHSMAREAGY